MAVVAIVVALLASPLLLNGQAQAYSKTHKVSISTGVIDLGAASGSIDYTLNIELTHDDSYEQGDSQRWNVRILSGDLIVTVSALGQAVPVRTNLEIGRENGISQPVLGQGGIASLNLDIFATAAATAELAGPARIGDSRMIWSQAGSDSFTLTIFESASDGDEIRVRIPVNVVLNGGISARSFLGDADIVSAPIGSFRASPVIEETIVVGRPPFLLPGIELWLGIAVTGAAVAATAYAVKRRRGRIKTVEASGEATEARKVWRPRPAGVYIVAGTFAIIGALSLAFVETTSDTFFANQQAPIRNYVLFLLYLYPILSFTAAVLMPTVRRGRKLAKFLCVISILASLVILVWGISMLALSIPSIIVFAAIWRYLNRPHVKEYFSRLRQEYYSPPASNVYKSSVPVNQPAREEDEREIAVNTENDKAFNLSIGYGKFMAVAAGMPAKGTIRGSVMLHGQTGKDVSAGYAGFNFFVVDESDYQKISGKTAYDLINKFDKSFPAEAWPVHAARNIRMHNFSLSSDYQRVYFLVVENPRSTGAIKVSLGYSIEDASDRGNANS